MNENIFDVLIYLFEHYMIEDIGADDVRADLEDELFRLGFSNIEVGNAFGWFDGLISQCNRQINVDELNHHNKNDGELIKINESQRHSMRYYLPIEKRKLSVETRGLLYSLEINGIINDDVREIIIDRMMAIAADNTLSDERAKWIIMMVLSNCHDYQVAEDYKLELAESFVFNDSTPH